MNCKQFLTLLDDLIDDSLTPETRADLQQHLTTGWVLDRGFESSYSKRFLWSLASGADVEDSYQGAASGVPLKQHFLTRL